MQCHNGDGTCHSDKTGQVQNPCPDGVVSKSWLPVPLEWFLTSKKITQMVREGTAGTNDGDGLAQVINSMLPANLLRLHVANL